MSSSAPRADESKGRENKCRGEKQINGRTEVRRSTMITHLSAFRTLDAAKSEPSPCFLLLSLWADFVLREVHREIDLNLEKLRGCLVLEKNALGKCSSGGFDFVREYNQRQ